jgi:predicted RNA-binding protein (virulence factor B family)
MARVLSKLDILTAPDRKPVAVAVPEWMEASDNEAPIVYVRKLGGTDRATLTKKFNKNTDDATVEQLVFAFLACDEHGDALFTDEDTKALAEKNGTAIARVARHGLFVNGFGSAAIEANEKNS